MTKTLILVRHSKPEDRHGWLNDFNRALTAEGKSDTLKMGNFLFQSGIAPDFILTSSANRAYETSSIFADVFKLKKQDIKALRKLYYGSAKALLDQIYDLPETIKSLMVVAHNPGISELCRELSAGRSAYMDNTQISLLTWDIESWSQIGEKNPSEYKFITLKGIE